MSDDKAFEAYRAAWDAWRKEHAECCRLNFITGHEKIAEAAFSAAWEARGEWEQQAYANQCRDQESERSFRHHGQGGKA